MKKQRTDDELKQIARDIYHKQIFHSAMISKPSSIDKVFLPLIFIDEESRQKILADEPALFFEYLSEAGPRSFNGLPMFMSFQYLSKTELPVVQSYVQILKDAEDKALGEIKAEDDQNHE